MSAEQDLAWPGLLLRVLDGQGLQRAEAAAAMDRIMGGELTPVQIGAFLVALRVKGETVDEIAGLVESMRAHALAVPIDGPLVDTCGTGGDRAGTFNISTLAALIAAGAGVRVAKHGNRAASSDCGSADLLEAWGVAVDLPPDGVAACIDATGIGFCFAPRFHPAMRYAVPARKELGVPTVFNFLGPLTNPAGAQHQTIGVADPAMAPRMAAVLAELGTAHALVFHGEDGLDELTTTGRSRVWEVRNGDVNEGWFDPADVGLRPARPEDLRGGDVERNRQVGEAVLAGEPGPTRDVALLAAAAALYAGDAVSDWDAGLAVAADAVDSGAAAGVLERLVAVSQAHAARQP